MGQRNAFGSQIRYWRDARGRTQLEVAMKSGYSQRHVSFLESGRARPSREAVLVMADTLDIPTSARNGLLEAAGFAPIYTHEPLTSARLEGVLTAVQEILSSHRPFPAILVDRAWNIFGANETALALFRHFPGTAELGAGTATTNAIRVCLDQDGLKPFIRNWDGFIRGMLGQLKHELERNVMHEELSKLIADIEAAIDLTGSHYTVDTEANFPVALLELEKDRTRLDLYTMMSAFNMPMDATLAELRIETFFPANPETRQFLNDLDENVRDAECHDSSTMTPVHQ